MNVAHFGVSPSGRMVRVGQGEPAYWAFVPNTLPPELSLDAELFRAQSDADRALGELAGLGRTMPNPDLIIGPFFHRVNKLVEAGILKQLGNSPYGKLFIAEEILRAISETES